MGNSNNCCHYKKPTLDCFTTTLNADSNVIFSVLTFIFKKTRKQVFRVSKLKLLLTPNQILAIIIKPRKSEIVSLNHVAQLNLVWN